MSDAAELDVLAGRVTLEAERSQAAKLTEELHRQIALCDEEASELRKLLANYQSRQQPNQMQRIQRALREAAIERRRILDMVAALDRRFA